MEVRKSGVSPTIKRIFEGPLLIEGKLSELDFLLQTDKGAEKQVQHNRFKPYEGVNTPRWIVKAKRKLSDHQTSRQ